MLLPDLRDLRQGALLSQAELAELAGVSRVTIINVEGGKPARNATIKKLAAALGMEPVDLLRRDRISP